MVVWCRQNVCQDSSIYLCGSSHVKTNECCKRLQSLIQVGMQQGHSDSAQERRTALYKGNQQLWLQNWSFSSSGNIIRINPRHMDRWKHRQLIPISPPPHPFNFITGGMINEYKMQFETPEVSTKKRADLFTFTSWSTMTCSSAHGSRRKQHTVTAAE